MTVKITSFFGSYSQNEKHKKEVTTVLVQTMFVLSMSANRSTDRTIWTGDFIARQCGAHQIRILFLQLQNNWYLNIVCLSVLLSLHDTVVAKTFKCVLANDST